MQIQALAKFLNAQVDPTLSVEITGVGTLEEAGSSELTFLSNPKYISKLKDAQAAAVLVTPAFTGKSSAPLMVVEDPYLAFAKTIELFHAKPTPPAGIHPTAVLGQEVVLGKNVSIGAYVVIGDRVQIGDGVTIHPHCMIYDQAVIGAGSLLHSHAVVRESVQLGQRVILQNGAVIGSDGYGFAPLKDGSFYKILQAGTVVIDDDVEVQAHAAIDRATIGTTKVGRGTKIDNLVQVGHGSTIGKHSLLCAQTGIAGSTQIGNHVILAGQAGTTGHLKVGDRVVAAARTGISQSVPPGKQIGGFPEVEHKLWLRMMIQLKNLPQIVQRLRKVEQKLGIR